MNFSVYNNYPIGQVYPVVSPNANSYRPIRPQNDSVSFSGELNHFLNKQTLTEMVNANPVIKKMFAEKGLKPVIDVDNFKKTTYKHSLETRDNAMGIYHYLPIDLKQEANIKHIQKGAMLHDIGKVLIPTKILNKNGALSPEECEIMHMHSKLSDALLSSQNIEPEVLNIVKYHHQNKQGTGYPEIKNTLKGFDINTEIVAVADKFSALKEQRAYKQALSDNEALDIIKKDVEKGNINPRVYNALVGFVNSKTAVLEQTRSTAAIA